MHSAAVATGLITSFVSEGAGGFPHWAAHSALFYRRGQYGGNMSRISFQMLFSAALCLLCPSCEQFYKAVPFASAFDSSEKNKATTPGRVYLDYRFDFNISESARNGIASCEWGDAYACYVAADYFNQNGNDAAKCTAAKELYCDSCNGVVLGDRDTAAIPPSESYRKYPGACEGCSRYSKIPQLKSACSNGNATSCTNLFYALHSSCPKYKDESESYMVLGCKGGDVRACDYIAARQKEEKEAEESRKEQMGGIFLGQHAQDATDPAVKRNLYKQSCNAGGPLPIVSANCNNYGAMLYKGEGGPQDIEEAKRVFTIICSMGDPTGCLNLQNISGALPPPTPEAAIQSSQGQQSLELIKGLLPTRIRVAYFFVILFDVTVDQNRLVVTYNATLQNADLEDFYSAGWGALDVLFNFQVQDVARRYSWIETIEIRLQDSYEKDSETKTALLSRVAATTQTLREFNLDKLEKKRKTNKDKVTYKWLKTFTTLYYESPEFKW